MVYLNVRHTAADYAKWRPFFDEDETRRRSYGSTGVNQVFRDADNPNIITLVMEWDNAENALKFINSPELGPLMQKAGVIGQPALIAVTTRS